MPPLPRILLPTLAIIVFILAIFFGSQDQSSLMSAMIAVGFMLTGLWFLTRNEADEES